MSQRGQDDVSQSVGQLQGRKTSMIGTLNSNGTRLLKEASTTTHPQTWCMVSFVETVETVETFLVLDICLKKFPDGSR